MIRKGRQFNLQGTLLSLAAALIAASCSTSSLPPPAPVVERGDTLLIDPRIGYEAPANPGAEKRFETIWRHLASGLTSDTASELEEMNKRNPDYAPAILAQAALALQRGAADEARALIDRASKGQPNYLAAEVYRAELAISVADRRGAYEIYRKILPDLTSYPAVSTRATTLGGQLFEETYGRAQLETNAGAAIIYLREAMTLDPDSRPARKLLVSRLVEKGQMEEARIELDALVAAGDVDAPEVQSALAEIEASRGRYQEAILRLDRLNRRTPTPQYARRLEEIKREWSEANMPPQFRRALESSAISRSDLAVLIYWKISSVRFAQNIAEPPIAVDIGQVAGREEVVRLLALGLLQVDPITRRLDPYRTVTTGNFLKLLGRLLTLRVLPLCAAGPSDPSEVLRTARMLEACGVQEVTALKENPEGPLSGRTAATILSSVETLLSPK